MWIPSAMDGLSKCAEEHAVLWRNQQPHSDHTAWKNDRLQHNNIMTHLVIKAAQERRTDTLPLTPGTREGQGAPISHCIPIYVPLAFSLLTGRWNLISGRHIVSVWYRKKDKCCFVLDLCFAHSKKKKKNQKGFGQHKRGVPWNKYALSTFKNRKLPGCDWYFLRFSKIVKNLRLPLIVPWW